MLIQLQTPIPIITPKGKAWAIALIDYGPQWDLQWVTFLHDNGECWTFLNPEIRQEENYTFGLPKPSPISALSDKHKPSNSASLMRPNLNGYSHN
jgi:hypothetical protein